MSAVEQREHRRYKQQRTSQCRKGLTASQDVTALKPVPLRFFAGLRLTTSQNATAPKLLRCLCALLRLFNLAQVLGLELFRLVGCALVLLGLVVDGIGLAALSLLALLAVLAVFGFCHNRLPSALSGHGRKRPLSGAINGKGRPFRMARHERSRPKRTARFRI